MKSFFKGMNLARSIMVVSVLGAIVLAWMGISRQGKVSAMRDNLDRVPGISREIVTLARRHTQLMREKRKEGLLGQDDPETYIRRIAAADKVDLGDVDFAPRENPTAERGVVDKTWTIKTNPPRPFPRSKISNFFFKLEADSRRIKVTDVEITSAEKRLKPEQIPGDSWLFQATVTSRQVDERQKKAGS